LTFSPHRLTTVAWKLGWQRIFRFRDDGVKVKEYELEMQGERSFILGANVLRAGDVALCRACGKAILLARC
jgi:hypothetical protein